MVGNMNPLFFPCPAMVALGTLLHIVGTATPNWSQGQDDSGRSENCGLWTFCYGDSCMDYTSKTSELVTCEAFSILAIFSAVTVLILCLLHFVKQEVNIVTKRLHINTALVLSLFSGICVMICVCVSRFGVFKINQVTGYSCYLSLAGGILLILSCGIFQIYRLRAIRGTYIVIQ